MNLVILAAGKSSRVFDKIKNHKALIKINKRTLIEKIIDDELNDCKVSKKKTSKPNIIINDDSNETKEKKVIKKIRIKKSNNNEI